ncbi:hypothetical protein J0H58_35615, partial [bacterium]|nr:hypothetical protein [bacterium]
MTARKTLNVRFAAAVAAATAAAATAVHFVHAYQVQRGAQELLAESARLAQAGEPAEATEYLDRYLLLNRDDADARTRYALLVAGQSKNPRQKELAYQALTEALARSPGRVEVLRAAVPVAADLGLRREARGFLEELRKAGVEDAGLMRHQARLELAERKPDKAEEWYRKAVNAAPADPEVSSELAAVLREHLHAPDLADREIDRLLRDGRGAPPVRLAAAQYFLRWGDAAKAERAVTTPAGDAAADDAGVLLAAAEAALAQNKTAAARRHLDRGVARHPRDSRFPSGLARLELRGGNRERALALVGPHAAAQNLPPEELWRLGNLLIDAGDLGKADDLIGRLGRDVPRWVPDYLRGRLAVGRQAWAEARQLFAAVTGGGHELPPELARQTYLLLADCHGRLGNPDGQLAAYRRVTELAPQWVPGRRLLGSAYATLGRLNEAAQEYRIVAVADPDATVEFARVLARQALRVPPADRRWAEIEELIDRAPPARRPEAQLLLA